MSEPEPRPRSPAREARDVVTALRDAAALLESYAGVLELDLLDVREPAPSAAPRDAPRGHAAEHATRNIR